MAASENDLPSVYVVLLAAGASRRFGDENKLLADIGGTPLVRRVVQQLLASSLAGVLVVTGFEADKLRAALNGLDVSFTENPDFAEGLASSLRCGVAALPEDASGAMVVLADMPGITSEFTGRLLGAFEQGARQKIVFPTRAGGAQGNPVIWPRRFFGELQTLTGDAGAKNLIGVYSQDTLGVPVSDESTLNDIDEPDDLETWTRGRV